MGLLSRFSTRDASPAPARAGALWRRAPITAMTAGDEAALAFRPGRPPEVLPSFALDFVQSCESFRPLEAHLAEHSERHGWSNLQEASLRSWLPRLIESGVLVSSLDLAAQCRAGAPSPGAPPAISAIGFPTGGDRAEMLGRAVESFEKNLRAHGRTADLLVADSSAQAAHREAFQARLRAVRGARVLYAGEQEKRRFAAALASGTGCAPDVIEFALFDPLGTGFACGANRNALLLQEAGGLLCSVDDDVVCRLAAAPQHPAALSLFSNTDPFSRWLFADRESALAAARFEERDFLGLHESMLGRHLGSLLPADGHEVDFRQAKDDLLRRMAEAPACVRATFTGHVGDPGIPTSAYFLYYQDENLERLTASEAHYRSVFGSRSVLTVAPTAAVGDASVSPGMAMGLDHRELLPPFFPVLHAEDFIFGATLWQCCPGSVLGHLPFAIAHEPAPGKPILRPGDLGPTRRAVIFELAHLMRRLVLIQHPPAHGSAAQRMAAVGRGLSELGRIPHRDFVDFLRIQTLEHESSRLDFLERQIRQNPDAPGFWSDDVQALVDHTREALGFEDFDIPFDLKEKGTPAEIRLLIQTLTGRFGALLEAWPALVDGARKLREAGAGLFVELPR